MSEEYKLSYTAKDIDEKLGKIDDIVQSPTITIEEDVVYGNQATIIHRITITNADGSTQSCEVWPGQDGADGESGGYYLPSVSDDGVLSWTYESGGSEEIGPGFGGGGITPLVSEHPIPDPVNIKGADGRGISSISVSAAGVWTVTYTDGTTQEVTPAGTTSVTAEAIKQALGYTPADEETVSHLSAEIDDVNGRFERVEIPGKNLLDESQVEMGYYVNDSNGNLYENASYGTSGFIPVKEGQTLTFQIAGTNDETMTSIYRPSFIAAYDENKTCLPDSGGRNVSPYVVPFGVSYIRFSAQHFVSLPDDRRMLVDSTELVAYEPYGLEVLFVLKPEHNNDEHIGKVVKKGISEYFDTVEVLGKNLLDPSAVTLGYYVNPGNGELAANASYGTTGFIPVEAGKTYTYQYHYANTETTLGVRSMTFIAAYDKSGTNIPDAGARNVTSYTVPDGVAQIKFSSTIFVSDPVESSWQMFTEGTEPQYYEPYGSVTKSVLKPENNNDDHIRDIINTDVGFVSEINAYLPKHLYCAVGRTIELYNNQVCLQADRFHMAWSCSIGKGLKRKFSVTGVEDQIGDYTLSLRIYNDKREVMWEGSCTLHVVSASIATAHSVCPIGDSLTNQKRWMPEVVNLSGEKISFVGTYTYNGKDATETTRQAKHEGRSGFTAKNYISGSPYTYAGATESPNNVFWDGSRFNWATYKTVSGLTPDAVQIFLGTNGLGEDNTENAGYIKQMVDYIRQDDANIPIFVVNTIYRSNQNGIGVQQSTDGYAALSGVWKYNEDRKIMNLMEILDGLLDGYSNLYMVNLALTHDSEYNFGAVETAVNPRAAQTEFMPTESVHPQAQGYFQMADVIFSVYAAAFG